MGVINSTSVVPALAVANEFIRLGVRDDKPVTILKLLKLVYFAHGCHLALRETPLIDEAIEAWKFGPVVPSIYHAFKENGLRPITKPGRSFGKNEHGYCFFEPKMPPSESLEIVEAVWSTYGKMEAGVLVNLTHLSGGPWHKAWFDMGGIWRKGTDIPDHLIADYFKRDSKK